MYFSMILNNHVDSYKYLPMNNLTFANTIVRDDLLNSPKDRKKVHLNRHLFKINWQIIKIIRWIDMYYKKNS